MPPKKPFRRDNKKRNSKKAAVASADSAAPFAKFAQLNNDDDNTAYSINSKSGSNGERTADRGLYGIYKQATQRFKEGLMALVPAEIFARDRVQTIMDAVDYLVKKQQKIDAQLLNDCRVSLQFRQSYSKHFEDGGDEGHGYFILVLGYCFHSLKPLVPQFKKRAVSAKDNNEKQFRFTDLNIDSDGEDEEKTEEDDSSSPPVRPPEPEVDYTIKDLVESTDRSQACLFLYNVEKCMKVVSEKYAEVKKKACYLRDKNISDASNLIGPLMTAAAATNFCIRQVQLMEEELKINLPHLSTFYRVISCVSYKDFIDRFMKTLKGLGKSVPRVDVTVFVGDVVEQAFRAADDLKDCVGSAVRDFCQKWLLPLDEVKDFSERILFEAMLETRPSHARSREAAQTTDGRIPDMSPPQNWLSNVKYTGGDRSILNTQSLVQKTAKQFKSYPPILFAFPGAYGKQWDERECLAGSIQGDMDQLLMQDIVPQLMYSCLVGPLCHEVPRADELLPFVKLLQDYVANPTKPVPLALTFGFHAILTSIYEVQGDDDVITIAKAAKHAYNVYFKQIDELMNHADFGTYGVLPKDVENLMVYQKLAFCLDSDERREARAIWNPCCAGMFLTYITFNVNVGGGAPVMNRLEQLRMILHLCNAFKQRGLFVESIPLLSAMDSYFEKIQYLWGGEKPKRESIVKKFWISYGLKAEVIRDVHNDCRRFVIDKKPSSIENFLEIRTRVQTAGGGRTKRDLADCHPEEISQAFRKICLGDYDGITGSNEVGADQQDDLEWNIKYARFLEETVTTMVDEEELVSWNLMSLGCYLGGFMRFLSNRLGWHEPVQDFVSKMHSSNSEQRRIKGQRRGNVKPDTPDSVAFYEAHAHSVLITMRFINHILGPLEFLESVESDLVVMAARDCLVEYFTALDPSTYKIFNTLPNEPGLEQDDKNSNQQEHDVESEQLKI